MVQDSKVIGFMTPVELAALMRETGMIEIHETGTADGKPVIHAALKVVNATTGETLPGGLPFTVVMFKGARDAGYSNIALGAIIPTAELDIALPRDYFNFCNQRYRFTRVFPLDASCFVLQMDLFLRNATREYVKFNLGVWSAMFSQILFELIGRGRESLVAAAEAYAAARTDLSQHYVSTVVATDEPVVSDPVSPIVPDAVAGEAPPSEAAVEPALADLHADAAVEEPSVSETIKDAGHADVAAIDPGPAEVGTDAEHVADQNDIVQAMIAASTPDPVPVAEAAVESDAVGEAAVESEAAFTATVETPTAMAEAPAEMVAADQPGLASDDGSVKEIIAA